MKEKIKNVLFNSGIVFVICFLLSFLSHLFDGQNIKEELLYILKNSLSWSIVIAILFIPVRAILEITNLTNIMKSIIALFLICAIWAVYICINFTIPF